MYSMVLMAALTTGIDMPDLGRRGGRGGGCCGGGVGYYGMGYGGCYGMGYGGCYGMGYGGCHGGYGMGYGGGCGGYGHGYSMGYGGGWGGYAWGGMPMTTGYAYSPMWSSGWSSPFIANSGNYAMIGNTGFGNLATNQSFYYNQGINQANEATIIVNLPADANLTIGGDKTTSRSNTRVFHSPPLEPGKTYTYELCAEINRDGRFVQHKKSVEVQAGRRSEVTFNFDNNRLDSSNRSSESEVINPETAPAGQRNIPRPPRD